MTGPLDRVEGFQDTRRLRSRHFTRCLIEYPGNVSGLLYYVRFMNAYGPRTTDEGVTLVHGDDKDTDKNASFNKIVLG